MPVYKYRDVAEMPRLLRVRDDMIVSTIRRVWNRAFLLSQVKIERGVRRFRNMEEANEARARLVQERVRRG